ncbi:PREDICTED: UDP-N-acetylglucosamine 1-carboxyvinyltransferase-like [Trachymyrmex cornetzi]|uniref:UDP-N-acetylglucosamine 1-carboxyvinyltransferase-like n=1 Tax=Trachymyrmex cornetzi TaxID=471704 RepID=UPI00084F5368|nr:PREDICTED: UDP-N-acetylglucosamine 1-carboxyvinyltransferase-like [Trachymyrmex cornetzi]
MLRSMEAEIFLNSGRNLTISGVKKLHKTNIHAIGDHIEAASSASLACASGGKIEVSGIRPELLRHFLWYYNQIGGSYQLVNAETILFSSKGALSPVTIETDVYPGFSTDWQQHFATLLIQENGMSVTHETVYKQRFGYLEVLNKLGAKTQTTKMCLGSLDCRYKGCDYAHSALIHGPTALTAIDKPIAVPDIRAGLAYLIAATLAEGTTILTTATHIERGYGNLIDKLSRTNLEIEGIPT